ncbi:hypothetical protein KUTeg_006417 [Tegillarca granosa]|uniref:Uncharacterized protein n=1 Tax=Tegillarca granosa TaxID=220873 RepID=A0ABQ9FGE3_TEGGR|nr:hypothetical protein KUTeg_006417 [Tegillarca granosa]
MFNEFPVPHDHIVQYMAYLILKSLSPYKSFLVNKLLEGIRRSGKSKNTRVPITLPILTQLPRALICICFSSYESKLFHAAFTLAFFGFLRVGEIAFFHLQVKFSNRVEHKRHFNSNWLAQVVCPVDAMKVYLSVRPAASIILFCHPDFLKKKLNFFNLPTKRFKSHSFRIGAASLASIKNIQPNLVLITNSSLTGDLSLSDIWIVGSSIVYWVQRRALSRPVGRNLGQEKYGVQIRWCSIRGMKLSQLLTRIQRNLRNFPCPHYLVIQLCSNDLNSRASGVLLFWSCILPRLFWYGARIQVAIDNVRKRTNREISSYILKLGGRVITQSDLSDKETGCYRFDGIHLSDIGNDIYLNALQEAL